MARTKTSYQKGESGNRSGRPPGAANVINAEGRELMHTFFTKNFKKLANDFENSKMADYQKWQVLIQIGKYIYPTQKAVMMDIDVDTITDAAKGDIIATLFEKLNLEKDGIYFESPDERGNNTGRDNQGSSDNDHVQR